MRKLLLLILIILVSMADTIGQNSAMIWYFGRNAGIDFNLQPPEPLTDGAIYQNEGCATLCNSEGSILLYTDGMTLYNKNHAIVENGDGLTGHPSSTQSGLIVPVPGSETTAYVFTVGAEENYDGVCYSIVDLEANNGLCKVTQKNIQLIAPSEEKITAVHHSNGTDIWVISHTWGTEDFYAFLMNESGLQTTPVISSVPPVHEGSDTHGYLKVSPTGNKIAIVTRFTNSITLYDFNNETGEVANPIVFPEIGYCYGLEFSPDGQKLYVTKYNNGTHIFQYDLSSNNPDDIFNSKYTVATMTSQYVGAAQLAPDGRIYVAKTTGLIGTGDLSVIQNPNESEAACNFEMNGFDLNGGIAVWGLPNFIQSDILSQCKNNFTWEGQCMNQVISFYADHSGEIPDSVRWNFGDPSSGILNTSNLLDPDHIYTSAGSYQVALLSYINNKSCITTKTVDIYSTPEDQLPDTVILCNEDFYHAQIPLNYGCVWENESTDNNRILDEEGLFWVDLENEFGCIYRDSIVVIKSQTTPFSLGNDTCIFEGNTLRLWAPDYYESFLWQDGSDEQFYDVAESGLYILEAFDEYGCSFIDSIYVAFDDYIPNILRNDTIMCLNSTLTISPDGDFLSYQWFDGSHGTSCTIDSAGVYWVEVENICGIIQDSIFVEYYPSPDLTLGNDTIICTGDYLSLIGPPNVAYLWQDGSTDPLLSARDAGLYWLEILDEYGCSFRDSIYLELSQPVIMLPEDSTICNNDSILLIAGGNTYYYEWLDGTTDSSLWVYNSGVYSVTATDSLGCTTTDETTITHINAPIVELGADTGFCDYDTLTYILDEPYTNYVWNGTDTSNIFIPEYGGEYWVTATNRCGEASDTIIIEKYFSPEIYLGPDTILYPNEELLLNAGAGYFSYLWNNGSLTPSIYIADPGEYYVTVWNEHCKATDSINIKGVPPFTVPNVFTPNNDGYNDDFEILGEYLSKFQLVIVNRWGETLYETNDINLRWDGTFQGRKCAEGVYFWIIRYQYPNENTPTTIQGAVTIIID